MKNLAGVQDCDKYIREELERADIEVVEVPKSEGEVPFTLEGRIGDIRLYRAWYYWVAIGKVPLGVAIDLYAHPEGKISVRVDGSCGCPDPSESPSWFSNATHKQLFAKKSYDRTFEALGEDWSKEFLKQYEIAEDITKGNNILGASPFITN